MNLCKIGANALKVHRAANRNNPLTPFQRDTPSADAPAGNLSPFRFRFAPAQARLLSLTLAWSWVR